LSVIDNISPERPVLIAGPTASGKSAIALQLAARQGGVIINADALQVFANWRILTARPSDEEESVARHALYGHVPATTPYSVGHWLSDINPFLNGPARPIIVGGTGLYFTALTQGLADIPQTPQGIRAEADQRLATLGAKALLDDLDPATAARIDQLNPVRVQRAWEVQRATGRGLAAWQDETPAPLLPLDHVETLLLDADKDWLLSRIERRFDAMLANGVIEEVRANLPGWDPTLPSAKAIGAPELVAHLQGRITLDEARERAVISSRQYAKRQRTWFRARMRDWTTLTLP
jgi:tRNA dimethylallyltransferase